MAVTLDVSGDWAVFDNPIEIRIQNPDETEVTTTIAIKRDVQYQAYGNLRTFSCRFHVWRDQMEDVDFIPRAKCVITDEDGVNWNVGHVDLQTLGTRYALSATMQVGIAVK